MSDMKDNDSQELDLHAYIEQTAEDKIVYDRNIEAYNDWKLKINKLVIDTEETFENIKINIESFISEIEIILESLDSDNKKIIENRIKGINMINKMCRNVLSTNSLNKISQLEMKEFENNKIVDAFNDKSEDEMRFIMNENYSFITEVSAEKSNLINKYFGFIENSILPIIDGIDSGISFAENSSAEIVKEKILPQYIKLRSIFDGFLEKCKISRIDVKVNDDIDFEFVEVLDVEKTDNPELDEKIESVIRDGYEYMEDIYDVGHNHVLRLAQVIGIKSVDN